MNWVKNKSQKVLLAIGLLFIVGGFPIVILSQNVEGYPHNWLTDLGVQMGMVGGGLIGVGIVLCFVVKKHQADKPNETRLKKKAWKDFFSLCVVTAVGLFGYGFLTYVNIDATMRIRMLITGLLYAGITLGLVIFLNRKNSHTSLFDERELHLIQRAAHIGNILFIAYVLLAPIIPFYLVGGRGMIPIWSIPLLLYSGMFLAGIVQFFILMHHAKEDDKNIEGGAV